MVSRILLIFQILRVKHYVKGVALLGVFIFEPTAFNLGNLFLLTALALSFGLMSSSIYIYNDLMDVNEDKADNFVSKRPYSSGLISRSRMVNLGYISLAIGLLTFIILTKLSKNTNLLIILALSYLLINFFYSTFRLKRFKVIGMMMVGVGFPIRFLIGSLALDYNVSLTYSFLVFLLATYIISGKRYYRELKNKVEVSWYKIFSFMGYLNILLYFSFNLFLWQSHRTSYLILLSGLAYLLLISRFKFLISSKVGWEDISVFFYFDKYIILVSLVGIFAFLYA